MKENRAPMIIVQIGKRSTLIPITFPIFNRCEDRVVPIGLLTATIIAKNVVAITKDNINHVVK